MTTFTPSVPTSRVLTRTSVLTCLRKRRRARGLRALAAGYRLMAWRALRRGDTAAAAMNAACFRALLEQSGHSNRQS